MELREEPVEKTVFQLPSIRESQGEASMLLQDSRGLREERRPLRHYLNDVDGECGRSGLAREGKRMDIASNPTERGRRDTQHRDTQIDAHRPCSGRLREERGIPSRSAPQVDDYAVGNDVKVRAESRC